MSGRPVVVEQYQVSDELWARIEPIIASLPPKNKKKPGRPAMDNRRALNAILYVLYTGCQWKALPRALGASSTVHDRFQKWASQGVFIKLWQAGLMAYDVAKGIDWEWQAADGCQVQAPLGGEAVGPSYKHHGKSGTNRSLLTDGRGVPLALAVDKANCLDCNLLEPTLQSFAIDRPSPESEEQNLSLDKGYDYPKVDDLVDAYGYTAHIRRKGEDQTRRESIPGYRARRWVVERTHAWMNNFRRLLIRWERRVDNYLALLHFACAWISFRAAGVLVSVTSYAKLA